MNKTLFDCQICGGQLEIVDGKNGILQCKHCRNKCVTDKVFFENEYETKKEPNKLFVETSVKKINEDIKTKKLIKSGNVVKTLIFLLTMIYVMLCILLEVLALFGENHLDVKNSLYVLVAAYIMLIFGIVVVKIKTKNLSFNLFSYIMGFIIENGLIAVSYVFLLGKIIDIVII